MFWTFIFGVNYASNSTTFILIKTFETWNDGHCGFNGNEIRTDNYVKIDHN